MKAHWNSLISGNEVISYEEYISNKYFKDKNELNFLSIGCGEGLHERNFCNHVNFESVLGIDISDASIKNAIILAKNEKKISSTFVQIFLRWILEIKNTI